MTLEPRIVEPGYAKRWPREALDLFHRSFHAWFALAVIFCLFLAVVPYSGVLAIPAGLAMYYLSVELAAFSDRRELALADLTGLIRTAGSHALALVWCRRWLLLITFSLSYALVRAMPHMATNAEPVDLSNGWSWCFGIDSPLVMATAALWAGTYYQGGGLQLAMMTYCVSRWAQVDDDTAYQLVLKAAAKNKGAALFLEALHLGSLLLAMMVLPLLTPLLACVLPALTYVSFREMFIDAEGNRKQQPAVHLAAALHS